MPMLLRYKGVNPIQATGKCGPCVLETNNILETHDQVGKDYLAIHSIQFSLVDVILPEDKVVGNVAISIPVKQAKAAQGTETIESLVAKIKELDPTYVPANNIGVNGLNRKLTALQDAKAEADEAKKEEDAKAKAEAEQAKVAEGTAE